ncbi:MAG: protein translocase subunit SecF [Rhizobiales bacterium 24-66-13]|jgi:preprotein translocase SecF subunit|uniref:protein translocase subunit SecF n=1 Tax=Roseixanthobacter finlandensis TaxID=3119922 RepID=UPI000BCD1A3D|nr:MAG: protein translocase subunit SecF [Rhizobiales bacterium 24-66-13]HQS08967.1 protein translocase subunit SecF [Xanthobacteraceae bacterium]HQS46054.1 protein translocase subunit SecF [Xanthobacteraceae bacterium]
MPLIDYIPAQTHFGFMRLRHVTFPLSAAAMVLALVCFATFGFNLGIDFRGGTLVEAQTSQAAADISGLREHLGDLELGDVQIQEFGSPRDVLIRVGEAGTSDAAQQAIVGKISSALGTDYTIRRVETVGPSVSAELVRQSIIALLLGAVAVLVYLWFRFEWQFAVGAIATTAHDIFVTLAIYSILGIDFDLTSIAAILTIMGYSLNDTVVVYDRIREMLRRYKRIPLPEMLDLSVNATFSRTIIVSLTTFLATLALYFFGGEVLRGFSLAMAVGIIVGTYSTIFVAAPMLIHLGLRPSAVEGEKKPQGIAARVDEVMAPLTEEAEILPATPDAPKPAPVPSASRARSRGKPRK